jgi:two-component system, OmpR family, sensor histidine kinase KdpD
MLDCPLYILTVDSKPFDEMDPEKTFYIESWKKIADEHNATEFILMDNEKRPVSKVIAEVARKKHVTQIILGQTAQSRWEQITKGSLINTLLHEIPFVDLHIISVSRYIRSDDGQYQKGLRAYITKENDHYKLSFKHSPSVDYEGIFFKEQGTDFDNGIFKFMKDKEMLRVQVTDGVIKELKSVDMNMSYEEEKSNK